MKLAIIDDLRFLNKFIVGALKQSFGFSSWKTSQIVQIFSVTLLRSY
jgi:hypothetical protein